MPATVKTKDNISAIYHVRENSKQEWQTVKSEDHLYYLYMKWQVRMIVTDQATGKQTAHTIGKRRQVNSEKMFKYDNKIGNFAYNYAPDYVVYYGKTKVRMSQKMTVKGADLFATLRSLVAAGNKGIAIDYDGLHVVNANHLRAPISTGQARKVNSGVASAIDPVVDNQNVSDDQLIQSGNFTFTHKIERDWTWFTVAYKGRQLCDYQDVAQLIPQWGKLLRETFGRGPAWSGKQNAFFIKTKVSLDDLQAFFALHCPEIASSEEDLEKTVVAKEAAFNGQPGNVVAVVKSQPLPETIPKQPEFAANKLALNNVKLPTAVVKIEQPVNSVIVEIDAKIEALKVALSVVDGDAKKTIQAKIASLNSAKQAHQVNSGVISAIDPVVDNQKVSDDQLIQSGNFAIGAYCVDRKWCYFRLFYKTHELRSYDIVCNLIPDFGKLFKKEFGNGAFWSDKHNAFCVKIIVKVDDLTTFFALHAPAITDTQIAVNVEDGCVVGFASPITKPGLQPAQHTQPSKPHRLPDQSKERATRELKSVSSEAYQQSFYEGRDSSKYMGYMSRENGRFGSPCLSDDYGDESTAD